MLVLALFRVPHFGSGGGDGGRIVGSSGADGVINLALDFINDAAGDVAIVDTVGSAVSRKEDIFECPEPNSVTSIDQS
jgi:hypothetical protein